MSYPYPQDRHRDRKEEGDQPYKDAREAMSQQDAELQEQAEQWGEEHLRESEEERAERRDQETRERLREIGEERRQSEHS